MPSLLTNERMSPELRARILQSLKGDARSRAGGSRVRHDGRIFRLCVFAGLVLAACALTITFRKSRAEFRAAHAELSGDYQASAQIFSSDYRARLARFEAFFGEAKEPYAGDFLAPRLKQGGVQALDELLAAPLVAVRGASLDWARGRRSSWEEGGPDSLVRCLIEPPADIQESTLLRHLGHIYQPKLFADRFVNPERALAGVKFVGSDFEADLKAASLMTEVQSLRRRLRQAELEAAAPFAEVQYLFYAMDEPKFPGAVSDFDGEAEHFIQLGLLDLNTGKAILRLRRRVDPDWLSEKSRLQYSRQLDSCRLAFEIREELTSP